LLYIWHVEFHVFKMADPSSWTPNYNNILYVENLKSAYIFRGILIFVIFRPRDMQEYIFMFSIALEWR
jgi:hypothetical protein